MAQHEWNCASCGRRSFPQLDQQVTKANRQGRKVTGEEDFDNSHKLIISLQSEKLSPCSRSWRPFHSVPRPLRMPYATSATTIPKTTQPAGAASDHAIARSNSRSMQ